MGLVDPQYEPIQTIVAAQVVTAPVTLPIVKLGAPSDQDAQSSQGISIHHAITPSGGSSNSGMNIDFLFSLDGSQLDDEVAVTWPAGNEPVRIAVSAAAIADTGVYHITKNYLTRDIGYAFALRLDRVGGDRTLTTTVTMRRWRNREVMG